MPLSPKEQLLFERARKKIDAINEDVLHSKGLTREEAVVAAKAGLIASDQMWFWLENWQKHHREAERNVEEGRLSGPFTTADELLAHLHRQQP